MLNSCRITECGMCLSQYIWIVVHVLSPDIVVYVIFRLMDDHLNTSGIIIIADLRVSLTVTRAGQCNIWQKSIYHGVIYLATIIHRERAINYSH